jgi:hypothetical protein
MELVETGKFNTACKTETEGFWITKQGLLNYPVFLDHILNTYYNIGNLW